jgi:cation diffusion facilitator family transporter
MQLSLLVGFGMLAGKLAAYWLTGSAAILSDAIESVIHVVAVGFAAFSFQLSHRPANHRFPYGYERIAFFSAGFEGALIILAAVVIIGAAVEKWIGGIQLEQLSLGTGLTALAGLVNAALGLYLVRLGRQSGSLIVEANGRHVLTDSWTSLGVVVGLLLVIWTGWRSFDPLLAIAVALNILWSGGRLVQRSVSGLMDRSDPARERQLEQALEQLTTQVGARYHALRFRDTGQRVIAEVHLLFPFGLPVGDAHARATRIEEELPGLVPFELEVVTHLEAVEDHGRVHHRGAH